MNSFGRIFRVSIFGESHGPSIGVILDGVPAGIALSEDDFTEDILRRAPLAKGTTPRKEQDKPVILSGLYNGHTTGAPLAIIFNNENTRSADYSAFQDIPRPGHADFCASRKWNGFNDPRGGGHFSGRLTLPIVAAGTVAKAVLKGLDFKAELSSLGLCCDSSRWETMLDEAIKEGDSLGGVIDCRVKGVPVGLGEPFWDSVESVISHAIFAIPGIRGIEFGDGFAASGMKGSEHNDAFGKEGTLTNGSGGINGGISNGSEIHFRVAVKPTSSISKVQKTWNFALDREDTLKVKGRHDVCFALRVPVIVEAMTAIALADLMLCDSSKLSC